MTEILKHLSVDVHCDQCGDFSVGADVIEQSQRLLREGCPGSAYECPPQWFATLLEPSALATLERAWTDVMRAPRGPVRQVSIDDGLQVAVRVEVDLNSPAVARWEDDGGYVPCTRGALDGDHTV